MFKKILSLVLTLTLLQSQIMVTSAVSKYADPIIYPHSDTYIRKNADTSNFSTSSSFVVDNSSANERISFIKFDVSEYDNEIASSRTVTLNFLTGGDASGEGFGFYLTPLYGDFKNIDLSTVTYKYAKDITSDGQSIIDYCPTGGYYDAKKYNWYSIDVTDYVSSQSDKVALFMLRSANGAFSIYSSEKSDCKPFLKVENGYTDRWNKAAEFADSICNKYNGKSVCDNLDFETSSDGYDISYTSGNLAYISDNGNVNSRPCANESDLSIEFTVTVSDPECPEIAESRVFNLLILKEGTYLSGVPQQKDNTLTIDFKNITSITTDRTLLEVPTAYFTGEAEVEAYVGSNKLTDFTPDIHSDTFLIDITDFKYDIISGREISFSSQSGLKASALPAKLLNLPDSEADVALALDASLRGKLNGVTSNLVFASGLLDTQISWESGNKKVISDDGRVERPESDTNVKITASFSTENYSYKKRFTALVLRENTDAENNEFPELKDPMHIDDEEFFGVWNNSNNTWTKGPILMYDKIKGLSDVEESAKLGNYEDAKNKLLAYYRTKGGDNIYTYDENNDYKVETDALYEKMGGWLQMDTFLASNTVTPQWQWVTFDLTDSGVVQSAYWLMDADMDGSHLEIESRENAGGHTAYLEVVSNGRKLIFPAIGDTYISAGDNINTNFGDEQTLYCREYAADSLTPFGTNSARPYFRFNTYSSYTNVTSIKLCVYARSVGSDSKKVYAMKTYDLKKFDENEFTWSGHFPQVFNFKETGNIWGAPQGFHQSKWNTSFEYINYWARLYQGSYLLQRYMTTGGEEYAYRAFEYAMSLYTQNPKANYPRALDGGWRIESLIRTFYTGINSVHMTPEVCTAFVKYLYTHGLEFQDTTLAGAANQDSAVQVNLARICAFLPEVTQDGWWENVLAKLENLYSNTMLNPDGSYTESTNAYITGVLTEMEAAIEIVKSAEGEDSYYYNFFTETYKKLVTYYMDFSYANGNQIPYGDGGRGNARNTVGDKTKFVYDGEWEYFATSGEKGTPISYTTKMYPDKALVMMRSGWADNDLCAFMSNDNGGSHGHRDDLALDVTAFNKYLLVDAGGAAYTEGSEFSKRRFDTIYHNTIEIDNKGQDIYALSFPSEMSLKTNDSFDLVHAGNKSIYPGFDVNRNVFMIKNRYLIVSDYIFAPEGEHTYRQSWHPDVNSNLTVIPESGTAFTNYNKGANIKIVTADPTESEAIPFYRLTSDNSNSESVQYTKENVSGDVTYDTVLYPTNYGEDMAVSIARLPLENTLRTDATAMEITLNTDKAYYYLSNEETYPSRKFGNLEYNGEMAYAEYTEDGILKYIALTNGTELKNNNQSVFKSAVKINDIAVLFEGANVKITSSMDIPQTGITFKAPDFVNNVSFNGKGVKYTISNGYITTKGEDASSGDYEGIKPGSPAPQGKPQGTGGGGSFGPSAPVIPVEPQKPAQLELKDIKGHWAEDTISTLVKKGVVSGDENGLFNPDNSITRAEFTKLVCLAAGLDIGLANDNKFTDVLSDDWFAPYVKACFDSGIINGFEDGTFKPYNSITRQEMAKLLSLASAHLGIKTDATSDISFIDLQNISPWAYEYVRNSVALKLVKGDDNGNFNPQKSLTRAEAATVILRLINKGEEDK